MDYIILAILMLLFDAVYLSTAGGSLFHPMIKNIQGEKMKLNIYGAIITYVLMFIVLYKFIIIEKRPEIDAFILGACIYGIFDFTNMAIFSKYEWTPALVDMVWGGCLFYITTKITYAISKM